jgi:hypothetical protein
MAHAPARVTSIRIPADLDRRLSAVLLLQKATASYWEARELNRSTFIIRATDKVLTQVEAELAARTQQKKPSPTKRPTARPSPRNSGKKPLTARPRPR